MVLRLVVTVPTGRGSLLAPNIHLAMPNLASKGSFIGNYWNLTNAGKLDTDEHSEGHVEEYRILVLSYISTLSIKIC